MAKVQNFETVKGHILYVVMFDGETVTLPHQNIQNNTLALVRGNGVVALSAGEITIHGSGQFLYYNNKWNYITPEVTSEQLTTAIDTLSEELGQEIERINSDITTLENEYKELQPQEYVLEVVAETGLDLITYQTYKIGKLVYIYCVIYNGTENEIKITPTTRILQLVGGELLPAIGRLSSSTNRVSFAKAIDTSFITPVSNETITPGQTIAMTGFLFAN